MGSTTAWEHTGPTPPPAEVMVIHKVSGRKKRFCEGCNTSEYRARFADEALF